MSRLIVAVRQIAFFALVAMVVAACSLTNQNTGSGPSTTTGQGAVLGQIVTAQQIDPQTNAPVNTTNTFSTQQPVIYAVVQAQRIEPGTSMFARWSRDGQPFEDSEPVRANQLYENRYVEFHLQSTKQQIDPGKYTVQVFVDGNPGQQTSFTVQ